MKTPKRYEIITKPTTDAFCNGATTKRKVVDAEFLEYAILAVKKNTEVERFFVRPL